MIVLTKGEIKNVIITGSENCLLINPYFLFVFINRITQEEVKFVVANESTTLRYDMFTLEVNMYFETSETGFWTYDVFEQISDSNLDISGLNKVETGYMYLNPAISFEPETYNNQSNSFITYNG